MFTPCCWVASLAHLDGGSLPQHLLLLFVVCHVQFCGLLSEGRRLCCAAVQGEEPAVHSQVCSVLNMHVYVHTDTQALYSIHVSLYVYWYCSYNVEDDQVNCFIRIPMEKIEKLIIGEAKEAMISILLDSLRPFVFPSVHLSLRASPGPLGSIIRSSKRLHLRLYYTLMDERQCYFTFRTVNFTSLEEDRCKGWERERGRRKRLRMRSTEQWHYKHTQCS